MTANQKVINDIERSLSARRPITMNALQAAFGCDDEGLKSFVDKIKRRGYVQMSHSADYRHPALPWLCALGIHTFKGYICCQRCFSKYRLPGAA